ncbi:MAG: DNA mismatch repair protein MutL [Candidatus Xenobia bacterium]
MARVQILEKSVAERIAAGEVVERPASVVKELLENSLDAQARQVTVELVQGGTRSLSVSDDGCGMGPEDARLALERFATSKISRWEDLCSLHSYGFRGEALPSIAAVSRFTILTCEPGAEAGTEVVVTGGVIERCGPAAAVPGTRITVEDLFFNTPARKKFLRSPAAETSQVVDLVGKAALSQPHVQFRLVSNGREMLHFPAQMGLAERLGLLLKVDAGQLVAVEGQVEGVSVRGLVGLPALARPNRTGQFLLVNGRIIRSALLSQAWLEGFTPLLPKGKYPVGILSLEVHGELVDVNVHPTKSEVRFASNQHIFRAVYRAVARGLEAQGADTVQHQTLEDASWERPEPVALPWDPPEPVREAPQGSEPWDPPEPARPAWQPPESRAYRSPAPAYQPPARERPARSYVTTPQSLELFKPLASASEEPVPLAQLHDTYLVALVRGELWVVDQHTAHERILYERLSHLAPLEQGAQGLVVPEVLELSPLVAELAAERASDLLTLGFELEPFGGNSFQLRSVPYGIPARKAVPTLRGVLEELAEEKVSVRHHTAEEWRERLRAMMACKAAVKAGDPLEKHEMRVLLRELLEVEHSPYCPHGRPTRVRLDQATLEKLFHRA